MSSQPGRLVSIDQLLREGLIEPSDVHALEQVADKYSVSISSTMKSAIAGESDDRSISRQFVPSAAELTTSEDELSDPIGDLAHRPLPGITHRYPDRALLLPLLVCPVYCRFCFRRAVVGQEDAVLPQADLDRAIDYIDGTESIWEVILTGGDPGMLSPRRLDYIFGRLESIGHVRTIRIHTRVPIVTPERITTEYCDAFDRDIPIWVAVHTNSVEEFTPESRAALRLMSRHGIPMVSQTVLLRGVNDTPEKLEALFRELIVNRVKPYYLHHLDLAEGTQHFRVPLSEGQDLVSSLRGSVSGLCLPNYVLDIPGGFGKVPIEAPWIEQQSENDWTVTSPLDGVHQYRETIVTERVGEDV